jgi:ribosome biogenesis GTPase
MELAALGWNPSLEESFAEWRAKGCEPGRVAVEDKHHYMVLTAGGEFLARISGRVRHEAASPSELPKVGDWTAVKRLPKEEKVVIHRVLPRRTRLSRKVPGRETEEQVLVTNIDLVFVVQALDGSFNARRMQRHLVMVSESGARAVVVLNKADICADAADALDEARRAAGDAPVLCVSAQTGRGIREIAALIPAATTAVFIGSSGVGKSSLINRLYGEEVQGTLEVRESDSKGRHATTSREMILLANGGIVIDTPGTREFHMWTADYGMGGAFQEIDALAAGCHYRDCRHLTEKKCAVREAVEAGRMERERYESYLKLQQEIGNLTRSQTKRTYLVKKRLTKIARRTSEKWNSASGRFE